MHASLLLTVAVVAGFGLIWRILPQEIHQPSTPRNCRRGDCQYGVQNYYFEGAGSARYNETPQPHDWRLLALDPACQPRSLIGPLINASRRAEPRPEPLVIMFFGDRCTPTAYASFRLRAHLARQRSRCSQFMPSHSRARFNDCHDRSVAAAEARRAD